MRGRLNGFTVNPDGSQNINVTVQANFSDEYDRLKNEDVEIDIKKFSKRRSMDANNYLWHLCSEIGKVLQPPLSKEEVYRDAIRSVGYYQPLDVREDAVESFANKWGEGGTGWFIDVIDNSTKPGYKLVHVYFGSSTYSSKEMSVLLNFIVQEAEEQGIPTMTENEMNKVLELWGKKKKEAVA